MGQGEPLEVPDPALSSGVNEALGQHVQVGVDHNAVRVDALLARSGIDDDMLFEDFEFGNTTANAAPEGTTVTDAASGPRLEAAAAPPGATDANAQHSTRPQVWCFLIL